MLDEFSALHQHIGKATISVLSVFSKSSRIQSITQNKSYIIDKVRIKTPNYTAFCLTFNIRMVINIIYYIYIVNLFILVIII